MSEHTRENPAFPTEEYAPQQETDCFDWVLPLNQQQRALFQQHLTAPFLPWEEENEEQDPTNQLLLAVTRRLGEKGPRLVCFLPLTSDERRAMWEMCGRLRRRYGQHAPVETFLLALKQLTRCRLLLWQATPLRPQNGMTSKIERGSLPRQDQA
jgi:hypothetical protein